MELDPACGIISVLERVVVRLDRIAEKLESGKMDRSAVIEGEIARLRALVEKLEAEKSDRSAVIDGEIARLRVLAEKFEAEKLDASNLEPEVARLVEKLVAENSNPPAALVDDPNSEEQVIHEDLQGTAMRQQCVDVRRNPVRHAGMNQKNGTSDSVRNSFEETLKNLNADGDAHLEVMLEKLREQKSFEVLRGWNPTTEIINHNRGRIISWVIHPINIHKLKDKIDIRTMRQGTPLGKMVGDIFGQDLSKEDEDKFKSVLAATLAKTTSPLARFLSAVVKVHAEHCSSCR